MKKFLLFVLLSVFFKISALSQDFQVDEGKFISETQKISNENHILKLVWWIPVDFWQVVAGKNPNISKEQLTQIVTLLKDYNIVAALDGKMGALGDVQYQDLEVLKKSVYLQDKNGIVYKPLNDNEINASTKNLIEIMKPMVSNMMGKMGENFRFFVFPAFDKNKVLIADPRKPGSLTIGLTNDTFKFKLPIESILKPKKCPIDGETMSGSWVYCPWHGVKLD